MNIKTAVKVLEGDPEEVSLQALQTVATALRKPHPRQLDDIWSHMHKFTQIGLHEAIREVDRHGHFKSQIVVLPHRPASRSGQKARMFSHAV